MRGRIGIVLGVLGLALAVFASPASAIKDGHIFDFEWGSSGEGASQFNTGYGGGLAINQSTGDIFVADSDNKRVQKFDEDGNFLMMWGYGVKDGANELQVCTAPGPCQIGRFGNAPGQFQHISSLAVDNSDGPNQGRVYVADATSPLQGGEQAGRNLILKFSPNGDYQGAINGEASPGGVFTGLPNSDAVDVDNQGFVWVGEGTRVMRFSNQPNNAYVGGSQFTTIFPDPEDGELEESPVFSLKAQPDGSAVYVNTYAGLYRIIANGSSARHIPMSGGVAFDAASGHFYINGSDLINGTGGIIQEWDGDLIDPKPLGPYFTSPKFCCGVTSYATNWSTGTVYALGLFSNIIVAFKERRVPESITEPATAVRHTTATLNGHTSPDDVAGGNVSACYFEWGVTKSYEYKFPCEPGAPISGSTDVSVDLSGLLQEGIYHFRLASTNSIDTQYGVDQTFITHAVIGVDTGQAADLTPTTAKISGSFDPDGLPTQYFFEWGKNEKLGETGKTTPVKQGGSGTGTTAVSETLEGLEDYTKYYYRFAASNSLGTSYGPKQSFRTTPPPAPSVAETAVSEVSGTTAHLSAMVTPNLGETLYGFEYGETPEYGGETISSDVLAADQVAHPVHADLEGLLPGRTYHYRALAINFGGVTYGPDRTFNTLTAPEVISTAASAITESGVRLSAFVAPNSSATAVRFEYGPSATYGTSTAALPIGAGDQAVTTSVDVGALAAGTLYHYRAVAQNVVGPVTGPDQTFITAPPSAAPPMAAPLKCKRGFVKRKGKCVKKRPKQRKANSKKQRNSSRSADRSAE